MARVLSVQSHVVCGYVGNRAATFPLQLLGIEVDVVNTVQFSNHTGYPAFRGSRVQGDDLLALIEGLRANDLLNYTHVLTGYIGSASMLHVLADLVAELKKRNPALIYVCDPVMGDQGKLYVPAELVPLFRNTLVPLADLVVPNQFELEQLCGRTLASEADGLAAIDELHARGIASVVVTSSEWSPVAATDARTIALVGSRRPHGRATTAERFRIHVPLLDAQFTGTGDLMAALMLAWSHRHPDDLRTATELALASVQAVLRRTFETFAAARDVAPAFATEADERAYRRRSLELRLIQSKTDLERPQVVLRGSPIL